MSERIRLMHHDAAWRQEFRQTQSNLLQSCQGWVTKVEHIGSTAIPGLIARPTIDVVAMVDAKGAEVAAAIESAALLIEGLNFGRTSIEDRPDWHTRQDATSIVLNKPRHAVADPTHRVLLVSADSPIWGRVLRIRDWLRSHSDVAIRFEEAKVARWRSGQGDYAAYQSDKSVFFAHLEDQIDAFHAGESE